MARGIAALNMSVVRNIVVSWVITLPAGAGLSILFFFVMKSIFNA
jgi:PiT family inorganic phosphate transporter